MDEDNFQQMISKLSLVILTGNLDTRIQFLGVLISHIEQYIEREKVVKDRDAILNTKAKLLSAFNYLSQVTKTHEKEEQVNDIRTYFKKYCIILDKSWGDPRAEYGAQVVDEIYKLKTARKLFREAIHEYSSACARGSSDSYARATILSDDIIKIIFDVCYSNKLIDTPATEFQKEFNKQHTQK
jgi:hypothetical protein